MRYLLPIAALLLLATGCATTPAAAARGFDPELTGYTYPFPVHEFAFDSQRQQLRMAYMDERPAEWKGRTVLLLHGKNFSGSSWEPTMKALVARGYRVVVPDQIGFGKSTKPATYQFSFAQLATNTRALLDSLGIERVSVVGHSMGGMLAVRFALQHPERLDQLLLVNPIGLEDYEDLVAYRPIDEWYRQELAATPESLREYQRQSYYAGEWKPEYERLLEPQAGWTQHPDYARVAWCSALTYDMIFTQPVVHDLPRLRVPTLLIIGQRDRTALGRPWAKPEVAPTMGDYPKLGRRTAEAIPNAKLVEFPGVGHLPQIEAFDRYIEALGQFLDTGT
ncbi:alpha/beta fold hydrolase [Hyalangium rubrum]|uniref:Alpha/beta hydrolase n=1 Tax=Hyalangium rubrum TaxID=3103134 RepID=A0ABU5HH33_9BACT|nr:alpha/beta hydrolase [Hyalangium sp. s54d21]MDY7232184.1 alpha/beta hydrolase [Hyalangium sp. s54d21]